jgi:hypothetical protein
MPKNPHRQRATRVPTPLGELEETRKNFQVINFHDRYGTQCSLQQSSIFDDAHTQQPGATAIWLGVDFQGRPHDGVFDAANTTRMHLDRKQVQQLVAVLEMWLQCGKFAESLVIPPAELAQTPLCRFCSRPADVSPYTGLCTPCAVRLDKNPHA